MKPNKGTSERLCQCGKAMSIEDAKFWGECRTCRLNLPIQTAQMGDAGRCQGAADRRYHGGRSTSEW